MQDCFWQIKTLAFNFENILDCEKIISKNYVYSVRHQNVTYITYSKVLGI